MSINLSKITLEKKGDSHRIDLSKNTGNIGEITINLNWEKAAPKKGFFSSLFGNNSDIDLDLGCFYQLKDGRKSVIDGLQFAHGMGGAKNIQTRQGCYTQSPWLWHTGDDRSGLGTGENILLNPVGINELERIVVYCFIYEGVAKWSQTNAVVTVKVPNNPDIVVEMGQQNSTQTFCAIAELKFDQIDSINVQKLVTFHSGHEDCDKVHSWGMKWSAGSK